jgi:hypothetical protein
MGALLEQYPRFSILLSTIYVASMTNPGKTIEKMEALAEIVLKKGIEATVDY